MHESLIKYPVAYNFYTNEIIPVSKVTKENRINLSCPACKGTFVAVLNHRTPHFKHKSSARCSISLETFLHWLTKEIFKDIEEVEVPELLIDDLPEKQRQRFQLKFNNIIDRNIPETFRSTFVRSLKENLSESIKLKIEKVEIEKHFKSISGNIRVDIMITTQGKRLFIEPFFTNPIDNDKKKKIESINVATLSIDLAKFIEYRGQNYSFELLKKYLISKTSKKWIYLGSDAYDKHIENYESYLHGEIEKNQDSIKSHKSILNKISGLKVERNKRYSNIKILYEEITNLSNSISDLEKELKIKN